MIGGNVLIGAVLLVWSLAGSSGLVHASDGSAHPAPTAPEVRFDTNMNGYIESEELKGAVASFFAQHMGKDDLFNLVLLQRHREYIPPPSLLDMRDAARWYQDGVEGEDEEWGERVLGYSYGDNPTAARLVSRYKWAFDEDMLEDERRLLYNLHIDFSNDEIAVEDILRVATLPWMFDANQTRAENDVRWFVTLTLSGESRPFAEKLLSKGWVLDDITPREWSIIHDLIVVHEADPEMSGYLLDEIEPPIDQLDKELARAARSLAVSAPAFGKGTAEWDRLRTEPWFLDGVDTYERVFLTTVPVYDALRQHLFSPDRIFIDSKTITLPLKGNVTLWVFYEASTKIRNAHELIPELEEAVRGAEEFVGVPFPKDHVIMFLWDIGAGGGRYWSHSLEIRLFNGDYAQPYIIHHEAAHFYFGPSAPNNAWFAEGGADLTAHFIANGRNMPPIKIPSECATKGKYDTLYDLDGRPRQDHWRSCSYDMGAHFLLALHNAMGVEAFTAAIAETYDLSGFGDLGYSDEEARQLTFDVAQYLFSVFMKHTPADRGPEALEVWRTLYGGPFIPKQ